MQLTCLVMDSKLVIVCDVFMIELMKNTALIDLDP